MVPGQVPSRFQLATSPSPPWLWHLHWDTGDHAFQGRSNFSWHICVKTSDNYLMGRSRTIGADNEMAGPPGGPSKEFYIGLEQ